jgi:hypothetical protein
MSLRDTAVPISCPACGHVPARAALLAQFERHHSVEEFADGSHGHSHTALEQRCRGCRSSYSVPFERVASLVIEKQTEDLYASISDVLRGKARLQ